MSVVAERRTWFGLGKPRIEERALKRPDVAPTMYIGPLLAGEPVSDRAALQILDVLAAVRCIVEAASTLPLVPYRRLASGRQRLGGGRLARLLRNPAPAVTQANFVGHLVTSLALRSEAFIGKYRNGEGEIEQIGVLPPDRVDIEIKGGLPLYTLTRDDGRQTTHGPSDIVYVRLPLTLDGVRGVAAISMAREALGLARALSQEASSTVLNSSAPLGVLTVANGPGHEDVMENLASAWELRHRGPQNARRVAVLAGEIRFQPISMTPHDMELVAQRKLSTVEIARLFRIPNWMLGADSGESLTYSNVETQSLAFVQYTLAPYLTAIEQAITADADLCAPNFYVEFLLDNLLRADSETRARIYALALDPERGWLRRDEIRRLENLDPEAA